MKTNFTKEKFLVLSSNEGKIVAIIQCKKGKQDITEKLTQAISEDYDAETVTFPNDNEKELSDFDYEFSFRATIKTDDYEYNENFTLTFTAVY
jgi:hypothetical protein